MKSLRTIQALRAFACIYVLLCHLIYYFNLLFPSSHIASLVYYGYSGVDMFFVISGFVIYTSTQNIEEGFKSFVSYLEKRLIRIYPIYWIVLFLSLVTTGGLAKCPFIAGDFLLVPHCTSIDVAWTLCFELYFYIVFGIGLIKKQLKIIPLLILAVSCFYFIIKTFTNIDASHLQLQPLFRYQVIEFFLGAAGGALYKKISIKAAYLFSVTGVLCFFSRNILGHPVFNYALPSMLLIMGLVKIESNKKLYIPAFVILLGDSSYIIYLIHNPFLRDAVLSHLEKAGLLNKLNFCLLAILVIVAGVLIHLYLEKPLLLFLNKKTALWQRRTTS